MFILITFASQVFVKGVLVSDHERCTALGQTVLHDRGSSVDAAIAAALCLGVVHPHVSGIGGYVTDWWLICFAVKCPQLCLITNSSFAHSLSVRGGVMLVHDIHKNETRVINFQGTAPKTLKEEIQQNVLELEVIGQRGGGQH